MLSFFGPDGIFWKHKNRCRLFSDTYGGNQKTLGEENDIKTIIMCIMLWQGKKLY